RRNRPRRTSTIRWPDATSGGDQPVWSSAHFTTLTAYPGRAATSTASRTHRKLRRGSDSFRKDLQDRGPAGRAGFRPNERSREMPAELTTIVLDCADPAALAAFYGKALGWEVTYSDDD